MGNDASNKKTKARRVISFGLIVSPPEDLTAPKI
ncbi:hypothetical protein X742_24015 [Mesorhizobium sp. LNHC232B00]|nr:hypothetical protein X742_24015 [Mesorhizobium sp. LNHC232B00]